MPKPWLWHGAFYALTVAMVAIVTSDPLFVPAWQGWAVAATSLVVAWYSVPAWTPARRLAGLRTGYLLVVGPALVLILTMHDTDVDILRAVEAGATGYLLKDAPLEELVAAVDRAGRGQGAMSPAVAGRLMGAVRTGRVERLSAREVQVLGAVAEGLSNAEIARRLHVTPATVKTHLVRIFTKLDVSGRTRAVTRAQELGIL